MNIIAYILLAIGILTTGILLHMHRTFSVFFAKILIDGSSYQHINELRKLVRNDIILTRYAIKQATSFMYPFGSNYYSFLCTILQWLLLIHTIIMLFQRQWHLALPLAVTTLFVGYTGSRFNKKAIALETSKEFGKRFSMSSEELYQKFAKLHEDYMEKLHEIECHR